MNWNRGFAVVAACVCGVLGCGTLQPPEDMVTYLQKSSDDNRKAQAMEVAPDDVKAAEQYYTKADEACDDGEQDKCDHYSTLAKIKFEIALDKAAIADAEKRYAADVAAGKQAKRQLEAERARKADSEARLARVDKINRLQKQLENTTNKAEAERVQHKIESEKKAAELQNVQSAYSQQKQKLDLLMERNELLEGAAKIVGKDNVKQMSGGIVVIVRGLFGRRDTEVQADGVGVLQLLAQLILKFPSYPIMIEGHTDSKGSDSANLATSQARAQSVMNQFLQSKVPIGRMTAVGHGEKQPISDNRTKDGQARNRRIEVKFLFTSDVK